MKPYSDEPLFEAVQRRDLPALQGMLGRGWNPNVRDPTHRTLLDDAVMDSAMEIVQLLLDHGADPNMTSRRRGTPIMTAAGENRVDIMQALVKAGADVHALLTFHHKPSANAIMIAARASAFDATRYLMSLGCDINFRSPSGGQTPLHYAQFHGDQPDLVKGLLELGADPTIADDEGRTALDFSMALIGYVHSDHPDFERLVAGDPSGQTIRGRLVDDPEKGHRYFIKMGHPLTDEVLRQAMAEWNARKQKERTD